MATLFAESHVATAAPFAPTTSSRARTVALWVTQNTEWK